MMSDDIDTVDNMVMKQLQKPTKGHKVPTGICAKRYDSVYNEFSAEGVDGYLDRMTIIRFDRDAKFAPEGVDGMYVQITKYPGSVGSTTFETLTLICMSNSAMNSYKNPATNMGGRYVVPRKFSKDQRIEDIVCLFYEIFQATTKKSNESVWDDLHLAVDRFMKNSDTEFDWSKDREKPIRGSDTIEFNKFRIYSDKRQCKSLRI